MAPAPEKLEEALIEGTCQVFAAEPDATTVNKVRKHVEDSLDLEDGFFTGDDWKQRSKALIKEYVVSIMIPCLVFTAQASNFGDRTSC